MTAIPIQRSPCATREPIQAIEWQLTSDLARRERLANSRNPWLAVCVRTSGAVQLASSILTLSHGQPMGAIGLLFGIFFLAWPVSVLWIWDLIAVFRGQRSPGASRLELHEDGMRFRRHGELGSPALLHWSRLRTMTSDQLDFRLGFDGTVVGLHIHIPRAAFASHLDEDRFRDCIEQHLPQAAPVAR